MEHAIVPRTEWLAARKQLLAKEKELTRQHDRLSAELRELPWVPSVDGFRQRHHRCCCGSHA